MSDAIDSRPGSSFLKRKPSFEEQVFSQHDPRRIVDIEHLNGHNPGLGLAHEDGVIPAKMTAPTLLSRIEQRYSFTSVQSCQIRPLRPIAFGAGPAKHLRVVEAAMLPRNDMLDMESEKIVIILA